MSSKKQLFLCCFGAEPTTGFWTETMNHLRLSETSGLQLIKNLLLVHIEITAAQAWKDSFCTAVIYIFEAFFVSPTVMYST